MIRAETGWAELRRAEVGAVHSRVPSFTLPYLPKSLEPKVGVLALEVPKSGH